MARKSKDKELQPAQPPETGAVDREADGRGGGDGHHQMADTMSAGMGMGMGMGRGAGALTWRNLSTFSSFRIPVFRLYYGAMMGHMAAMNMQMIARSLLIFHLTGSASALGIMALGSALPMFFFSLFGGVMADRVEKKKVLLAGQATSGAIALAIALALTFGFLSEARSWSWLLLVVAAMLQGGVMGLMMPSRQAMLAEIVGEEQLMNALALNTLGMNLFRLMAPAIAGFLIAFFDFNIVYFVMAGSYVVAVGFVLPMPRTSAITIRGRGALRDIGDGFRYIRQDTLILVLLAVTLAIVLLSMPYMLLLPLFSEERLDVGRGGLGLGLLISVSGIGALIGSLVLASLPNKRRGVMMLVGSLILGLALVVFAFSTWFYLSLVIMLFVGLGQTARMTLSNTLHQYYVADEYRGRVMSIYMMEFGLASFAVFFAGIAADTIGVQWAIGGMAAVLVVLMIALLAFSPRLRRLD